MMERGKSGIEKGIVSMNRSLVLRVLLCAAVACAVLFMYRAANVAYAGEPGTYELNVYTYNITTHKRDVCSVTLYVPDTNTSNNGIRFNRTFDTVTNITINAYNDQLYDFCGWYLDDPEAGSPFSVSSTLTYTVNKDTNIYAVFEENHDAAPYIYAQPKGRTVVIGDKASFSVTAKGWGTLSYQWQICAADDNRWFDIQNASAKTRNLEVTTSGAPATSLLRCKVTSSENGKSSFSKEVVFKTVTQMPETRPLTITLYDCVKQRYGTGGYYAVKYPDGTLTTESQTKTFNVYDGDKITVTAYVQNNYRFVGWYDNAGEEKLLTTALSYTYTVTENRRLIAKVEYVNPPVILEQPEDCTALICEQATYTLKVSGSDKLTYKWQYRVGTNGWIDFDSAVNGKTTLKFTASADMYNARVRCVVRDIYGGQTITDEAQLYIFNYFTKEIEDCYAYIGDVATFSVKAFTIGYASYQWQYYNPKLNQWKNSTNATAKSPTLKLTVQEAHSGFKFRCTVSDSISTNLYSPEASLFIKVKIVDQPKRTTVCVGEDAKFTVKATGVGTLKYQWQVCDPTTGTWKNSSNATAKKPTFIITTKTGHHGYKVRCLVSAPNGAAAYTKEAELVLKPAITKNPANVTAKAGDKVSFTVKAAGCGTLAYQWQIYNPAKGKWENSTNASAKKATFNLIVQKGHNGFKFRCVVTDGNGHRTASEPATLTVK
jgi:Listeria-Bacteroides repeat domain (List_Bact_rpt).